jgi:glycerate 2-kinase
MRILVAPQEFKGSLTAHAASEAIVRGLRVALPDADLDLLPMADGGPGTLEVLVEATGGRFFDADVRDPLGRPARARWSALGDGRTAIVEMAEAFGPVLVRAEERDPRRATTYGTGELLRAALDAGYRRIIVGVGGSATNDGGVGLAQALGARLLDAGGHELPPGGAALARLARIDPSALDARLRACEFTVAADVTNPLCGPEGASLVYGAQKGASDDVARELDVALAHFARIVRRDLGVDVAETPGAGAAGGLAYGLLAFCGATLRSGFEVVADAVGLPERVRAADLIVTGEGRLDRQTAFGKTPAGVARAARAAGKPVVAVVGSMAGPEGAAVAFDAVFALTPDHASRDEALSRAAELVTQASEGVGRWWRENTRVVREDPGQD